MRRCGVCHRSPRYDDPLGIVQVEAGPWTSFVVSTFGNPITAGTITAQACVDCAARLLGQPAAPPRRYPVGCRLPRKTRYNGDDADIDVCGICRTALREDEEPEAMRVSGDDLYRTGIVAKPGMYMACPRCVEIFRPVIHERLLADGTLPADAPIQLVAGFMLR